MIDAPVFSPTRLIQSLTEWARRVSAEHNKIEKGYFVLDLVTDNSLKGFVLKDANGNYWRITTDTAGSLITTNIGTTLP